VPAWKCGCARTGQLTATRATGATRATRLIPAARGSPPVRRTARARPSPVPALECSLASRCHHLVKTFWRWRDTQLPDGTVILTAPTGHTCRLGLR
jgi:hypothetical protein